MLKLESRSGTAQMLCAMPATRDVGGGRSLRLSLRFRECAPLLLGRAGSC